MRYRIRVGRPDSIAGDVPGERGETGEKNGGSRIRKRVARNPRAEHN